jgi:hypothetical protein
MTLVVLVAAIVGFWVTAVGREYDERLDAYLRTGTGVIDEDGRRPAA